ncbi:SDR family NAD(P)-dependent oxidoreductase [Amycolatopsis pithecellobii]|uniref:SDR family oxidoreductase n=1 Tax=Amycolatopsis pithecellobii TaxID=664692 RepID=A0A6N7YYV3_9PSEU|nr:glucose 1-dehydrogenase [Amycolatopsis pithecellobii]MTD52621.1 SDR family oxidoreductase [Amycolatopsis pithecellobii]
MTTAEHLRDRHARWELPGKRALVTGAATGIGQGIAVELAARGANVVVHHAGSAPAETLSLLADVGKDGVSIKADLSRVDECERLIEEATQALGGLDILVNNAGISVERPIEQLGADEFDSLFAVNVRGTYLCLRAAIPALADGGGSVVNLSSVHAFAGLPPTAAYAASKGAINAMTRTVAMELIDRRIRVNAVGPGLIETPRYFTQERTVPYTTEWGAGIVPWGRVGRPQDIGSIVAFLASDAADFITGQVIYADGGTTSLLGIPGK